MTADYTDRPFRIALRALMHERDLSFRELAKQTGRYRYKPYSTSYITHILAARHDPTPEAIAIIARAAGVEPEYFKEYREHVAAERARKLTAEVGLDRVLEALRDLDKPAA